MNHESHRILFWSCDIQGFSTCDLSSSVFEKAVVSHSTIELYLRVLLHVSIFYIGYRQWTWRGINQRWPISPLDWTDATQRRNCTQRDNELLINRKFVPVNLRLHTACSCNHVAPDDSNIVPCVISLKNIM